jgi:hypothetical protein
MPAIASAASTTEHASKSRPSSRFDPSDWATASTYPCLCAAAQGGLIMQRAVVPG